MAAASFSVSRPRSPFRPPPPPTIPSGAAGELFSIRTCFKFRFAAMFGPRSLLPGFLGGRGAALGSHRLRPAANSKWRRGRPRRVVTSPRTAPPTGGRAPSPAAAPAHCAPRGSSQGTGSGLRTRRAARHGGAAEAPRPPVACRSPSGVVVPVRLSEPGEPASDRGRTVFASSEPWGSAQPGASPPLSASAAPSALTHPPRIRPCSAERRSEARSDRARSAAVRTEAGERPAGVCAEWGAAAWRDPRSALRRLQGTAQGEEEPSAVERLWRQREGPRAAGTRPLLGAGGTAAGAGLAARDAGPALSCAAAAAV